MVSCFLPSHIQNLYMCLWCTCFRDQIHLAESSIGILQNRLDTEFCWPLPDWPLLKVVQEERKVCTAKSLTWEQGNAAKWGLTCGVTEGLMGQSVHSVQWKAADQPGKDVKEDNQLRKGEQWLTEGWLNKWRMSSPVWEIQPLQKQLSLQS